MIYYCQIQIRTIAKFFLCVVFAAFLATMGCRPSVKSVPPVQEKNAESATGIDSNAEILDEHTIFLLPVSSSPQVGVGLMRNDSELYLNVNAEKFRGVSPQVKVGISAAKSVVISSPFERKESSGMLLSKFRVNVGDLIENQEDWKDLRMGLELSWKDVGGEVIRRERYEHRDGNAPHAPLSVNPLDWKLFDLAGYERMAADQAGLVRISFEQPMNGKLTVVIEDDEGKRIRNLISGKTTPQGPVEIMWDCLDEDGKLVAPGNYQWRSLSHPGIKPMIRMAFGNGNEGVLRPFGSNHNVFKTACKNDKYTFLASSITEGGESMIALGADGMTQKRYHQIHGTGLSVVTIAANEKYLYVMNDGPTWGSKINRSAPDWKVEIPMTLTRYEVESERSINFPDNQRFVKLLPYEWGPGSSSPALKGTSEFSLQGLALIGDFLYVSARHAQAIVKINAETGEVVGRMPLANLGVITSHKGILYVAVGSDIVRIDPATGVQHMAVPSAAEKPQGVSVGPDDAIYVSDGVTNQVRIFASNGQPLRALGTPGGPYQGEYDIKRMLDPKGLVVNGDTLWVTEDRRNPKRVVAWDLGNDTVKIVKYGNPPYGGPGAGFDFADASRWIGMLSLWDVDIDEATATPTSILQEKGGHLDGRTGMASSYRFYHHENGRTFLLGMGMIITVSELMPDGSVKDLAAYSSIHHFSYGCGWYPPQSFIDAVYERYPDKLKKSLDPRTKHKRGRNAPFSEPHEGVLWVDRNGDGILQKEEFSFSLPGVKMGGSRWGTVQGDLDLRIPILQADGRYAFLSMKPDGFLPNGVPNYPELPVAISEAVPFGDTVGGNLNTESILDRNGNMIINSAPDMVSYGPDGSFRWRFPNQWKGVAGSHHAPLPEEGIMQGNIFFLGIAPLKNGHDVFMLNGNHGRFFALTSDGMYLDEMFHDVRIGAPRDEFYIGGEAFGGFLGYEESTGKYYLQTGGAGYRIYELNGLDQISRSEGGIKITAENLAAAERDRTRKMAEEAPKRDVFIPLAEKAIDPRKGESDFQEEWTAEWGQRNLTAKVKVAYDQKNIYLHYVVNDDSPWTNNGKDWQTLFKTGDSVDFQLGTSPHANGNRSAAVPGDLRVLIAPYEGKPTVVLYRHRIEGAGKSPVVFSSPWRSETVDEVRLMEEVVPYVKTQRGRYEVTVEIPLRELALPATLAGLKLKGDFGVLHGDREGTQTGLRSYWSNKATGLVSDVPGEIMLQPNLWGSMTFTENALLSKVSNAKMKLKNMGVLLNSGGSGKTLVNMGSGTQARGLGVVCDRNGGLWDRGGDGQLNRYAVDGRLLATYPIESGQDVQDKIALVEDTLVLQLKGKLYTLSVDAPAGTAPQAAGLSNIQTMSHNSLDGKLVLAQAFDDQESLIGWWKPAEDRITEITRLPWKDSEAVDVVPDGTIYVLRRQELYRVKGTRLDTDWKIPTPGGRVEFVNGAWYGHGGNGTTRRFDSHFNPDPGVVLGGASGSFLGHLAQNTDISNARGMCHVEGNLYAISGMSGVIHLMEWDESTKSMTLLRRIGGLRDAPGLVMDGKGHIYMGAASWNWGGGPDTPQVWGIPAMAKSQGILHPNEKVLIFGRRYGWPGFPTFINGSMDAELAFYHIHGDKGWDIMGLPKTSHFGPAICYSVNADGRQHTVFMMLDADNKTYAYTVNPNATKSPLGEQIPSPILNTKKPVVHYTSLAMADENILLAAGDGSIIRFERDGQNWQETGRFTGGAVPFGSEIHIRVFGDYLWVSDTDQHRVICFDAASMEPISQFGKTNQAGVSLDALNRPTELAPHGNRCVVFDSENQRLVKLELQPVN